MIEYPDVEGPPLTDELVRDAESLLGVRLPDSYLALMRKCNGGYVTHDCFPMSQATSWADDHIPVDTIRGIAGLTGGDESDDRPGAGRGILVTPYLIKEWGLPADLVVLDGDGHRWIALDYRTCGSTGIPTVAWLNPDRGEDLQIAPDFESFIESLVQSDQFHEDD